MYWDTHMHCKFSGDSTANPEDMILSAVEKDWMESVLPTILITIIRGLFHFNLIRKNISKH